MRSRFAAYALGLGSYLVRTLASTHPDSSLPQSELERTLSRVKERQRFTGLRILHASSSAARGEVLFFARIFEKGQDRSFAELSDFTHDGVGWRYADGILVPRACLPLAIDTLTVASFLSLAEKMKSTS
jgi:SEC-C motif domain protein